MSDFKPIVHKGDDKLCGHSVYVRSVQGWASDCDSRAAFVRATEYGAHEYACADHVAEMAQEAEADR